jgi:hypothetical protein
LLEGGSPVEEIPLPDEVEARLLIARRHVTAPLAMDDGGPELETARVEELASAVRAGDPEEIGAMLDTLPGPHCDLLDAARRHPSVYGARCVKEFGAVVALVRRGEAPALVAA